MKFFWKSGLRLIFVFVFIPLASLFLLLQFSLSRFVERNKPGLSAAITQALGAQAKIESLSFSLIRGLEIKGLSIALKQGPACFIADKVVLNFNLFSSLLTRRLKLRAVSINSLQLRPEKTGLGINLQVLLSDIFKNSGSSRIIGLNLDLTSLNISVAEARIKKGGPAARNMLILKDVRIYMSEKSYRFNSRAIVYSQVESGRYIERFLNTRETSQELSLRAQGAISGRSLQLGLIEIGLFEEQILGTGIIRNYLDYNPQISLEFIPAKLKGADFSFLRENFSFEGRMLIDISLSGPMDDLRPRLKIQPEDCAFTYKIAGGEKFRVENMSGVLEYADNCIKIPALRFKLNAMPLFLKLSAETGQAAPGIAAALSIDKSYFTAQGQDIKQMDLVFDGKLGKTITGSLRLSGLYDRQGTQFEMTAKAEGLDFDYYSLKDKYLKVKAITLSKSAAHRPLQKFEFSDLSAQISLKRKSLALKEISGTAYAGTVRGEADFDWSGPASLQIMLSGEGLDCQKAMPDINVTDKILSGRMQACFELDNRDSEFIQGEATITNGNADLSDISNSVKFPPLDKVRFNRGFISFAIHKDRVTIKKAALDNPDIALNGSWIISSGLQGLLELSVSSKFLKQSVYFRKLLAISRLKKPAIDFKFILGGTPETLRFMWLEGEFRDRIDKALSPDIKSKIEDAINKAIQDLAVQ